MYFYQKLTSKWQFTWRGKFIENHFRMPYPGCVQKGKFIENHFRMLYAGRFVDAYKIMESCARNTVIRQSK